MTTALLRQALEALTEHGDSFLGHADEYHKAITAIRDYLKREEALQRMVDHAQELGLYEEPKFSHQQAMYDAAHALQPTYAGRALVCPKCKVNRYAEDCKGDRMTCPMIGTTTTVTDPAAIRAAFEKDSENE